MYDKRIYNTNSGIITFQQLLQTIRKFSFMGFFFAHTVFCIAAQITHSKKNKQKNKAKNKNKNKKQKQKKNKKQKKKKQQKTKTKHTHTKKKKKKNSS